MNDKTNSSTHFSDTTSEYSDDECDESSTLTEQQLPSDDDFQNLYLDLIKEKFRHFPNNHKKYIYNYINYYRNEFKKLKINQISEIIDHIFGNYYEKFKINSSKILFLLEKNRKNRKCNIGENYIRNFIIVTTILFPKKKKQEIIHELNLIFNLL
jgi:hypothetical protein